MTILFIGNSLTAANDFSGRLNRLSGEAGHRVAASSVTISGASLADHWQDGRAVRTIRKGRWNVVALQQGPSTLPESRAELIDSTRAFAREIRAAGARPALMMIWPLPGQTFEAVGASYRAAAAANDALLLPAGEAWQRAGGREASPPLFGPDGFHPTAFGTELAALTVYCTLFPEDRGRLATVFGRQEPDLTEDRRRALVGAACASPR